MQTKLFLLVLLLIASAASLQALPMDGLERLEEKNQKNSHEAPHQFEGSLTIQSDPSSNSMENESDSIDNVSVSPFPTSEASKLAKKQGQSVLDQQGSITKDNAIVQGAKLDQSGSVTKDNDILQKVKETIAAKKLSRAEQLIYEAYKANNPDAASWGIAQIITQEAKDWADNIINPPEPTMINKFFGETKKQFDLQTNIKAKIVRLYALALEAALPAWQATTAALKAANEAQEAKLSHQETPDYWSFRKVTPPDFDVVAAQKVYEAAKAWEKAKNVFFQVNPFPDSSGQLGQSQLLGKEKINEVWEHERKKLEYAKEIWRASFEIFSIQQKLEQALNNYDGRSQILGPDYYIDALKKIYELINKEKAFLSFQSDKEAISKRLNYIIAVYEARLATARFDDSISPLNKPDSIEELGRYKSKAVEAWKVAIKTKKETLSEESREKIEAILKLSLSASDAAPTKGTVEPLTAEEQAALDQITGFQQELESIDKWHMDESPQTANPRTASSPEGTEGDGFSL